MNINNSRGVNALGVAGLIFLLMIAAAIAIPLLQRAAARQWASEMENYITQTVAAQKKYFAKNGAYTYQFDALDLKIDAPSRPPVSAAGLVVPSENAVKNFRYYEILLNTLRPAEFESVTGVLLAGHYSGAGLTFVFTDLKDGKIPLKKLLCFEIDDIRYTAAPGAFCEGILGYKYIYTSKFWGARFYAPPPQTADKQ